MATGGENVTIRINVKADTREIDRVRAKLAALCAQADSCRDTFDSLGRSLDDGNDSQRRFSKGNDDTGKSIRRLNRDAQKLVKVFQTGVKFAMIGSAIETAALAVALSSVNGLLAVGRFAAKGYQMALSGVAKAAAAAGVALATLAAAQRQYVAAQASGRYGGFQASSYALRTMTTDARLAGLSMKSLNQAFLAASKNAKVTGVTSGAIAGLMDFAAISGDIEKGVVEIANLVSLIQKGGVAGTGVSESAKKLGPEFEKAFKEVTKGGKASAEEVLRAFSTGELAKKAGIGGTFATMQGTLMGQFKAFIAQMQNMFADLGSRFIAPVQAAFEEIRRIMVRTFTQISPILQDFATGGMLDKVVNGVDKISQFLVTLLREYVPITTGFFAKMSAFWDKLTGGFEKFNTYLKGLTEASKIINTFFGKIFRSIGGNLKDNFEQFSDQIVKNEDNLMDYGDSVTRLIDAIFKLFRAIRDSFFDALPAISRILDVFSMLLNLVSKLIYAIGDLGRILGSVFGASGAGGAIGGLIGYLGPLLMLGGLGRMARGRSFMGGGMKKAGNFLMSPLGLTAVGALGTQAITNRGNTAVETAGDIGTGALVGAGLGKYGLGLIQRGATNAYVAGQGLAEAGGRFAGAGSRLAGAASTVGSMSAGQVMGAGALLAGGAVATHVGSNLASGAVYRASGGNRYLATATGATTGAITGAATGAALTSWLGPGAIGGAIVGAIIGSIWGGVNGLMQDSKYKKQAKKAAQQFVKQYSGMMEDALASNDVRTARKLAADFDFAAVQMSETQIKSGTALKEANKQWYDNNKNMINSLKTMEARFTDLNRVSGMTESQIQDVANAANIDLGNSMLNLQQILEATGIATFRFGEEFKASFTDVYAEAVSGIRRTLEIVQAPDVYAATGRAFGQKARSKTLTDEDRAAFFETIAQQELLLSGGDPLQAFKNLVSQYGTASQPGGQFFFQEGGLIGDLTGQQGEFFGGAGAAMWTNLLGEMGGGLAGFVAENLISEAARLEKDLGVSKETLTASLTRLGTLDPNRLIEIATATTQGQFLTPELLSGWGGMGVAMGETVAQQLSDILGEELAGTLRVQDTASSKLTEASTGFKTGADTFDTAVMNFQTAVDDFQSGGDTRTPRRNFVDAMGAHTRINSMISGNRTMTSGYRTGALGSLNSDHAAGRAYDLIGQNLGMYQMAVRSGGGYAEFHGGQSSRHLHVVPNVNNHIGDDPTPVVSRPITSGSSTTSMVNNITINQQPGQSAQALAQEVMYQIEKMNRSRSERY